MLADWPVVCSDYQNLKGLNLDIEEAIRHALDGRAVLFIGAGFSYGAVNTQGMPIPAGKALATHLLREVGYASSEGPLDKAAAAYLRRKTQNELVRLLLHNFSVQAVTNSHVSLASLPWRRVYTTNYDLVYEEAGKKVGIQCNSIDGIDSPRDHLSKPNLVVHINGAITRLTNERLGSSFKLISESYATESFEGSEWAFHFRNDIRTASAIIFVGYSMYDLDLRRAIYHEDISDKCVFITAPPTPENELDAEDLSDQGVVAPIGVDEFAKTIEKIRASYSPQEPVVLLEAWAEFAHVRTVSAPPSDPDVLEFLMLGDVVDSLLLESCGPRSSQYIVPRLALANIDVALETTDKTIILTGDLGVGKTFVTRCVAQLHGSRGERVFFLNRAARNEIAEAQEICHTDGKKLLVIENYHRHMELIRWFVDNKPDDVKFILTARSSAHDVFAKEVFDLLDNEIVIFDLSKLHTDEEASAVGLFDRYGFWGDRMAWGRERKQRYVRIDCKGRLPFLLIEVLKAKHLTERYQSLLSESSNRPILEKVLICTFALEVMGFVTDTYQVQELLGNRVNWGAMRARSELKEFLDFDSHSIRVKSSVLASHLLHNIFSAKEIVSTLIDMAHEAEARRSDDEFFQILHGLMRFGSIATILPELNRLAATTAFYEGIKNLSIARRNPQFWLQYAIACLAFGKLDRAERYFDDAYSFAKQKDDYDTYQIDNHYARLLLEKALLKATMDDVIFLVEEAKKIVLRQMQSEYRYYPYRVALGFFRCYQRFLGKWPQPEILYFKRIFEEIKRRCESVGPDLRDNTYVKDCLHQSDEALLAMSKL